MKQEFESSKLKKLKNQADEIISKQKKFMSYIKDSTSEPIKFEDMSLAKKHIKKKQ